MNKIIKILKSNDPHSGILDLFESGVLQKEYPYLYELHSMSEKGHKNVFYHTLGVIRNVMNSGGSFNMLLVALLHDIGKPSTKTRSNKNKWSFYNHELVGAKMSIGVMKDWGLDDTTIDYVYRMIKNHGRIKLPRHITDSGIRRLDKEVGTDIVFDVIDFCRCDLTTSHEYKRNRILEVLELIENKIKEVRVKDNDAKWRSPITGYIIMDLLGKDTPGRLIGQIKAHIDPRIKSGEWTEEDGLDYIKNNY